ncbi:sushi, von Willebrand factor type A, EGF and pentraxin domain-containing protein 1-like [Liolophura sinensis]|uniref:sushi, von Willebrand factor type A, EGF and pentraxin domain-containing protein 1-like n=1 Tax=Liolophura sinensis TaxID=3198878 RepID=UPI003158F99B
MILQQIDPYSEVYSGLDESGYLFNTSGQNSESTRLFASDKLYLELNTNYGNNSKGFKASFSVDCEKPNFNLHTTPSSDNKYYKSKLRITCDKGYHFRDEMYQPQRTGITYVEMESVYCGLPQSVDNGYVETSTGVVFGKVTTYNCFDGYTLAHHNPSICESDGRWTDPPACIASNCSALEKVENGNMTVDGDGSSYSTVVEYTCQVGFEIIGANRIFCTSGSTWSHPSPTCFKVQCQVPEKIMNGYISAPDETYFGDTIDVSCDSGYRLSGPATLSCQANQQFGNIPECIDIDECAQDQLNNCTGVAMCENEPGMYSCACPSGYTLNNDSLSCSDVDECSGKHYCSNGRCVNNDGSYSCECFHGYELFSSPDMEVYTIPVSENGYRPGDVYYINHTCVRVICPTPPVPNNTLPLTGQSHYGFGDWIRYMCKLGYVLSFGVTNRECQADGTWSMDPPVCSVARCPPEVIPDWVQNSPRVSPGSDVDYLNSVTLTCNIPGMDAPVIKHRTCLYDQMMNTYRFFGAPFECGYIDCGEPEVISGAKDYRTQLNNSTIYGQSFQVECLPLFTVDGESSLGNTTVTCLKSGTWGFNTLRCLGETCSDPGRPPDAIQEASGYEQGKKVSYKCTREGFELNDTTPLSCVQDPTGTTLHWDHPVPFCKDMEKPKFDSCRKYIEIDQFEEPGFDEPFAIDNSGLVSVFSVQPEGFSPEHKLADSVEVTYHASDATGNTEDCQISVHVRAFQRPDITCPNTEEVLYPHMTADVPLSKDLVNTSGVDIEVTLSPSRITPSDVGKYVTVQAWATDKYNRAKSCSFQVHVKYTVCAEQQIAIPVNGDRQCKPLSSVSPTSLSCSLTCKPGFTFYQDDLEGSFKTNCTDGTGQPQWTNSETPNCVSISDRAQLEDVFQFEYQPDQPMPDDCIDQYRVKLVQLFTRLQEFVSEKCSSLIGVPLNAQNSISATANGSKVLVHLTVQYSPINESSERIKFCSDTVTDLLSTKGINPDLDYLHMVEAVSQNCSALTGQPLGRLSNDYTCPSHQKLREDAEIWWCLNCPAGSMISTAGCEACGIGTYQENEGERNCIRCADGFFTYLEGRSSPTLCTGRRPDVSLISMFDM